MRQIVGMLGAKGSGKDTCAAFLANELGFVRVGFADTLYQEVVQAYGVTIGFLAARETKERNMAELALRHCKDVRFAEVALESLTRTGDLRRAALWFHQTGKLMPHQSRRRIKTLIRQARSPRWTMQLWGTEYRRKSKYGVDSYWLDRVRAAVDGQRSKSHVITDVRFNNEANFVEDIGGILIRVRRPILEAAEAAERKANGRAAHPSETELLSRQVDVELINEEGQLQALRRCILEAVQPSALSEAA